MVWMRGGLPGPSGPDPGTVGDVVGQLGIPVTVTAIGVVKPPQLQVPAPHLRVVSRREKGKSCPTGPHGQVGVFPHLRAEPLSVVGTL